MKDMNSGVIVMEYLKGNYSSNEEVELKKPSKKKNLCQM